MSQEPYAPSPREVIFAKGPAFNPHKEGEGRPLVIRRLVSSDAEEFMVLLGRIGTEIEAIINVSVISSSTDTAALASAIMHTLSRTPEYLRDFRVFLTEFIYTVDGQKIDKNAWNDPNLLPLNALPKIIKAMLDHPDLHDFLSECRLLNKAAENREVPGLSSVKQIFGAFVTNPAASPTESGGTEPSTSSSDATG